MLVHLDDSLRQLAETFNNESVGAAVVKETNPPALISERDIVNAIATGSDLDDTRVRDVMTEDVAVAAPTDDLLDVAFLMLDNEIRHIPVIEDGVVIGMVSGRDVLRALAAMVRST
jgi:CBS domain-containing protein